MGIVVHYPGARGTCKRPGERMNIVVATERDVVIDAELGTATTARELDGQHPTCLAADPRFAGRAWCGTQRGGVFRTDDAGASWQHVGLEGRLIMSLAASPTEADVVWAGTEPSEIWRSGDAGDTWHRTHGLDALPSSPTWSFPPKPDTHHVRWIACHPVEPGRIWVAIEAGALVSTPDGGRTWHDRVPGGRPPRLFAVKPAGLTAVRAATGAIRAMTGDLAHILGGSR